MAGLWETARAVESSRRAASMVLHQIACMACQMETVEF